MTSTERLDRVTQVTGATVLLLALLAGDGFTFLYFGLGCGLAENVEPGSLWDVFCRGPWVSLPVIGGLGAVVGYAALIAAHSLRGYWLGVLSAVLLGGALWILVGDPAGNFTGLLS